VKHVYIYGLTFQTVAEEILFRHRAKAQCEPRFELRFRIPLAYLRTFSCDVVERCDWRP